MPNKYAKYFKILELDIQASKEDVKKAFSELSHIWHPDNYMDKPSNIQNRATRKFKKISTAYQVLNEYLSEEDSDSEAEEKTKAEQERREKEKRKQREENERLKKEEEIGRKAEQERREKEEKEHLHWEEQANKKREEEKSKKKNTSWCRELFCSFIEVVKISMGLVFLISCSLFIFFLLANALQNIDRPGEVTHQVAEKNDSEIKVNKPNNSKNSQSDSFSWTRSYVGNIYGKQGLTMQLERNGDELTGAYLDIHEMKEKKLRGRIRKNLGVKSFILGEFIDFKRTGTFHGKFTSEKTIEGEWRSEVDPTDKTSFKLEGMEEKIDDVRESNFEKDVEEPSEIKTEYNKWLTLAEQGNAEAQFNLGLMYFKGQGVPQDYVLAHMWWNICFASGIKVCVKNRNIIENRMSKQQIEKAQEMARNWKPTSK